MMDMMINNNNTRDVAARVSVIDELRRSEHREQFSSFKDLLPHIDAISNIFLSDILEYMRSDASELSMASCLCY